MRWLVGVLGAALVLAAAALLWTGSGASDPAPAGSAAFSWVRPGGLGSSWSSLRLPGSPARLPVPPGWRVADGDPGTRTAELTGRDGAIVGYLNATPQQGEETPGNWAEFRVEHNRDEEERDVELLAAAGGLRFAAASGSCVVDSYVTSSDHRYREIACIVAGHSATTVVVGAAPPRRWAAERAELRQAISNFRT